jgi:hypothetical protein
MAKKSAQIIEIRKLLGETCLTILEQVYPSPLRELRESSKAVEDKRFKH